MSISTIGSENVIPMHGVAFPEKDTQTQIPDEFTVAYEGFVTNARGTEALDDMFAIGREAEFTQGTTSLTRKAQEALDSRIRSNTEIDILNGAMTVPAEIDEVIESPSGWRERIKARMRFGGSILSLRDRMHDAISEANEKTGARNRGIATLLIGTVALGAAYLNLKTDSSTPQAVTARTEEVAPSQYEMNDSPVSPSTSVNVGEARNPFVAVEPKTPTTEQVFQENYSKLDDQGRDDFKGMMKWEDEYIDKSNLEQDPKRGEKAVNAFARGLRYMKSLTKRVR